MKPSHLSPDPTTGEQGLVMKEVKSHAPIRIQQHLNFNLLQIDKSLSVKFDQRTPHTF